jgi:hypothetical protein
MGTVTPAIFILPPEIAVHYLQYVSGDPRLRLVNKAFKDNLDKTNEHRFMCRSLLDVAQSLNAQIRRISEGKSCLISDIPSEDPRIERLTPAQIARFRKEITTCPHEKIQSVFQIFKLTILDALCDVEDDYLAQLQLPPLPEVPPHLKLDDILAETKKREKATLCILDTALIWGDQHRKFGNYGTEGGEIPTLRCFVSNAKRGDWTNCSYLIDEYLPAQLFMGIRDGGRIRIQLRGKTITLVCTQWNYNLWGNFETLVAALTKKGTYALVDVGVILSPEEQLATIQQFHHAYIKSIPGEIAPVARRVESVDRRAAPVELIPPSLYLRFFAFLRMALHFFLRHAS